MVVTTGYEDEPPATVKCSMDLLKTLSKPAAWGSGWTSAFLCFSAATGYWVAGEHKRAVCWIGLGAVEVAAIVL